MVLLCQSTIDFDVQYWQNIFFLEPLDFVKHYSPIGTLAKAKQCYKKCGIPARNA